MLGLVLALALAPPDSETQGRLGIRLDTAQFGVEWDRVRQADPVIERRHTDYGFGVGGDQFGFGGSLGLGRGLVVGLGLGLAYYGQRRRGDDLDAFGFGESRRFEPHLAYRVRGRLEYAFAAGRRARPFVFVHGGLAGQQGSWRVATGAIGSGDILRPTLGGGLGVHLFVAPRFSFDLFAQIDHAFETQPRASVDAPGFTQLGAAAGLGVSTWFARRPRKRLDYERHLRERPGSE